jgi:hypothetical protein
MVEQSHDPIACLRPSCRRCVTGCQLNEAADFAAQLPTLLRGAHYEQL